MNIFAAAKFLNTPIRHLMKRGVVTSAVLSDSFQVPSENGPLLVRLCNRPFGATAELSPAEVSTAAFGAEVKPLPQRISVVRDAFYPYDEDARPLNKLLKELPNKSLAVHVALTTPEDRAVVDEYVFDTESKTYKLQNMARDLIQVLQDNLSSCQDAGSLWLVPDIESAGKPGSIPVVGATKRIRQSSNNVLMVSPTAFGFNEQAAQDNSFMHAAESAGAHSSLTKKVLLEFAAMYSQLADVAGVKISLFEHSLAHNTPDACFPNNWFSTHQANEANGGLHEHTLVLYPMKCPNRAAERRQEIIKVIQSKGYDRIVDLAPAEANKKYFEGTGVLVIDRINGVAYVDISERADEGLAKDWAKQLGYKKLVTFRSSDLRGKSVYHTNVMMAVGTGVAIVCADSVKDATERSNLLNSLKATHEVVEITLEQMDALCGNALEVQGSNGLPYMAMSTQAYNAFTPEQRSTIRRHVAGILHAPIDTLERVGGGGVRCTLAEIF